MQSCRNLYVSNTACFRLRFNFDCCLAAFLPSCRASEVRGTCDSGGASDCHTCLLLLAARATDRQTHRQNGRTKERKEGRKEGRKEEVQPERVRVRGGRKEGGKEGGTEPFHFFLRDDTYGSHWLQLVFDNKRQSRRTDGRTDGDRLSESCHVIAMEGSWERVRRRRPKKWAAAWLSRQPGKHCIVDIHVEGHTKTVSKPYALALGKKSWAFFCVL